MPTLSSILVQRGAASMRAVEDAIARQVFHGGDLATNLLELAAIREDALVPILAEMAGLAAAPLGRLPAPPPRVLRLVPGELALRHGIFPLELEDRALVVATAEPLSTSVEDDLGFALDLAIVQRLAPLVRIRQAIAEHYGIPLERRFLRLVAKLEGQADPSPSALPPPDRGLLPVKMPRPISIPSPSFGTGVPSSEPEPARLSADKPAAKTPFVAAHEFVNPSIPKSPPLPVEAMEPPPEPTPPPAEALPLSVEAAPAELEEAIARVAAKEDAPLPRIDVAVAALAPTVPADAAPVAMGMRTAPYPGLPGMGQKPRDPEGTRALAGIVKQALREERAVDKTKRGPRPAWRPAHRRKGPFTTAMAERELEEAAQSDAVLEIVFAFAQQFFEYTALFVVHGDLAEGRDASGPGADRAAVAAIGVALDLPSSLSRTRERRAPFVGRLSADGLDAELVRDLHRSPRTVALLPVVVRTRVVAVVYGDDGEADVELSALGDVLALIGLAGAALERIALRKKLGARAPEIPLKARLPEPPSPEVRAQSVAALARVVAPAEAEAAPAAAEEAQVAIEVREEDAPAVEIEEHEEAIAEEAPPAEEEAPVATFTEGEDEAAGEGEDEAAFGVSPPEEDVLPPSQGPRTARYFDDAPAAPPPHVAVTSLKQTQRGLGGIKFPDATPPPPAAATAPTEPEVPAVTPMDSWLPIAPAPTSEPAQDRKATPPVLKRGPAPIFEGRSAARVEPAITMTSAAPEAGRLGFEPLPRTPPPNATAWTSFPSAPPPEALIGPRPRSERPIPREEQGSEREPDWRSPRVDHTSLPSIVVDVGAEYQSLIQRVIEGARGSQEAFAELVKNGEQTIAAIMARFPGPLRVDRHRARGELPAASQCGPVLEMVAAIRRPALPFISVRLSASDPEVRFWAAHVLGELRYPEAASALLPRLFDDDASVRRIARRSAAALVSAGAAGVPILKGLDDITQSREEPVPNRVLAVETMGEIRSGAVVPSLVAALADPADEVVEAARRALLLITRQDFGKEAKRWQEWWAKNGRRHRIEWLIDALMHDQPSLRRAAGDELKQLTKEYFGYYDDLPKRERERAQAAYRAWWDREGRSRFT
jgi:hypothetical protein